MNTIDMLLAIDDHATSSLIHAQAEQLGYKIRKHDTMELQNLTAENLNVVLAIIQIDGLSSSEIELIMDKYLGADAFLIMISEGTTSIPVSWEHSCGTIFHMLLPLDINYVVSMLREIWLEVEKRNAQNNEKKTLLGALNQLGPLCGSSPPMMELFKTIRKVARTNASVLITGETGTGKELVARAIHGLSDRHDQPLMTLNCGAIASELIESELFGHKKGSFTGALQTTAGIFEQARGGTLFLDEIGEMPASQQVHLLRVLESGDFKKVGSQTAQHADVRIIAATNSDLTEAINSGRFREDLFYRLAQFPVEVPPLRLRGEDIEGLASQFLASRNAEERTNIGISDAAIDKLKGYTWPGNVRELKHAVERAYILADHTIESKHLAMKEVETRIPALKIPSGMPLASLEKAAILQSLRQHEGNKRSCAQSLGISVKTLYNKLERYSQESPG
ncbi:MAG: sigma-54 dependent transcriptional regulator [Gammaproteobacteria bacterium]